MSEENIGKTVYFTLDPDNPPQMTDAERTHLENLRDEEIDFSDIPRQTGIANWSQPGRYGGPVGALRLAILENKVLFLEEDMAQLLQEIGESGARRMNDLLRAHAAELKLAQKSA